MQFKSFHCVLSWRTGQCSQGRLLRLSGNVRPCEINHKIKTNNATERIFSNDFDKTKKLYLSYFHRLTPAHRLCRTAGQVYSKEVSFVGVVLGSR